MWNEKELLAIKEISENFPDKSLCYRLHQVFFTDSTSKTSEDISLGVGSFSVESSERDDLLCSPSFDLFEPSNPNLDSILSIDDQRNTEILYWEQFSFVLEASSRELDSSNLGADLARIVKVVDEGRLDSEQYMEFWKEFLEKQSQDSHPLRKLAGLALLISFFSRNCENITRQQFHNILSNNIFDVWSDILSSLVLLDRFTDQHLFRQFLDLVDFQLLSDKFSSHQAGIILNSLTKVVDHWNENCLQIAVTVLKTVQKSVQNVADYAIRESMLQLKINAFDLSCLIEALLKLSQMENASLPISQHSFNLLNILIRCFPFALKTNPIFKSIVHNVITRCKSADRSISTLSYRKLQTFFDDK